MGVFAYYLVSSQIVFQLFVTEYRNNWYLNCLFQSYSKKAQLSKIIALLSLLI